MLRRVIYYQPTHKGLAGMTGLEPVMLSRLINSQVPWPTRLHSRIKRRFIYYSPTRSPDNEGAFWRGQTPKLPLRWCRRWVPTSRPRAYQARALPTELRRHLNKITTSRNWTYIKGIQMLYPFTHQSFTIKLLWYTCGSLYLRETFR